MLHDFQWIIFSISILLSTVNTKLPVMKFQEKHKRNNIENRFHVEQCSLGQFKWDQKTEKACIIRSNKHITVRGIWAWEHS